MDLTLYNSHKELADKEKQTRFDNPLSGSSHSDTDKHIIGESLPSPQVITDVDPSSTASVGSSPNPAREDHEHGPHNHDSDYSPVGHSHTIDNDDLPNPITKFRFGAELGSSAAPSFYWPDISKGTGPSFGYLGIRAFSASGGGISIGQGSDNYAQLASTLFQVYKNSEIWGNLDVKGSGGFGTGTITASSLRSDNGSGIHMNANELDMNQHDIVDGNTIYMDNWYRSTGNTGWFNETHQCGVWAQNTDWIYTYFTNYGFYGSNGMGANLPGTTSYNTIRYGPLGIFYQFTSNRWKKEKIQSLTEEEVSEMIDQLNPVSFIDKHLQEEEETPEAKTWREADKKYGFIAEEVFEVAGGHLANIDFDKALSEGVIEPNGWDESAVTAVNTAEIKFLRQRVKKLEELLTGQAG